LYLDLRRAAGRRGTRCASITGAYVALSLACERLRADGLLGALAADGSLAAVSCGMVEGRALLDLDYSEDSTAEVDANVVMTGDGGLVEVAGDGRAHAAVAAHLDELLRWRRRASSSCARRRSRRSPRRRVERRRRVVKLLLATHNEHKRREFARLLPVCGDGSDVALLALPEAVELPPEDGETFAENALGKARAAATGTGRPSVADDSGIESAALGGAPGVRSARYAGEDASDQENLGKLLAEAPSGSALEYVCAIAREQRRRKARGVDAVCRVLPSGHQQAARRAWLGDRPRATTSGGTASTRQLQRTRKDVAISARRRERAALSRTG